MELVLATKNKDKILEMEELLKDLDLDIYMASQLGFDEDIEESGKTFEENALLKASAVFAALQKGVVADDSGLEVEALDGAPGVYSSRFAGADATHEENNRELLRLLAGIPYERRRASFRTVLALILPGQREIFFYGRCDGYIATQPKGEHGFGYDPLFVVPSYGKTFGELGLSIKNCLSHRAQALYQLKSYLLTRLQKQWVEGAEN